MKSVHTVWDCNKQNVASFLSLDVAGAFNHASHPRLLHNLRSKGIPEYIVKRTESFLKERSTSVTIGRRTSEIFPIDAGIPQGSPISHILFLCFNVHSLKNAQTQDYEYKWECLLTMLISLHMASVQKPTVRRWNKHTRYA